MADNVTFQSGTPATPPAGTAVALDEVTDATLGTVKVQYVKLMAGTLDSTEKIGGDAANGLDVDVTRLPATTNAGATAKTTDYDTGAGTDTVTMLGIALPASGGAVPGGTATNPVRTDPTGTTPQPVTGTFWQGTQPVSGPLTDTQLRASAVPMTNQQSNTTADYDTGAGTQNVTMFGVALPASGGAVPGGTATNPLRTDPTGVTPQPISGTVMGNQGTANTLANAWPAKVTDGTNTMPTGDASGRAIFMQSADGSQVSIGAQADTAATSDTGTFSLIALVKRLLNTKLVIDTNGIRVSLYGKNSTAGDTALSVSSSGYADVQQRPGVATSMTFQSGATATGNGTAYSVSGMSAVGIQATGFGAATILVEGTIDGTNWLTLTALSASLSSVSTISANGLYVVPLAGVDQIRCRISAYTSGTLTVTGKGLAVAAPLVAAPATIGSSAGTTDGLFNAAYYQNQSGGGGLGMPGFFPFLFNKTTWDRHYNNTDASGLTSAARTATTATPDQTNFNGRGALVVLSVTAASGTGGLTVQVQGKDSISSTYYQLNASPTAVLATGIYVYAVYPTTLTAAGGVTQAAQMVVPRTWRANVSHGDASSYTYSVSVVTIL